ncbi:SPRY domain-containing protein 3-like protein [Lates japonicus]|uniref:SPRY domain-containing protein 3-like protein n=1 Tax=Lates japonicus TaxID=270547 RepID=A0AAD3NDZ0_LATJO|nr:SPRY domain-containing protein 3-like protein [Lates japonicus]
MASEASALLEYVGKGKSIMDVGLAQARQPLTTRCHYYEVEIVDAGEKCYIALGLARRDYPRNRHPGWSRGSVAYHADVNITETPPQLDVKLMLCVLPGSVDDTSLLSDRRDQSFTDARRASPRGLALRSAWFGCRALDTTEMCTPQHSSH